MERSKIDYLVIHDTGNARSGANAEMHYVYFNTADRNASADFFVDDKQILQINNFRKYYTWAVGDGKGAYDITNRNSISIEICVNADSDYNVAFIKTIELTKHLMKELDIPASKVVRHYDASRKNCPGTMAANNWAKWNEFKAAIQGGEAPSLGISNDDTYDAIWIQISLNSLGYSLVADGDIGPLTKSAIKDFQGKNGLVADGIVGPLTIAKLNEALKNKTKKALPGTGVEWLDDSIITSDYGEQRVGYNHHGIDFILNKDFISHIGSPGTALIKSDPSGYGKYVEVKIASGPYAGWSVIYSHLENYLVSNNQEVKDGMPIGLQGATGNATTKHLHLEVRNGWEKDAKRVDPRIYINDVKNHIEEPLKVAAPTPQFTTLQIQENLNRLGYNLVADGIMGPITKGAIRSFQSQHNLTADGIYGLQTDNKLKEVIKSLEESQKEGEKIEIKNIQVSLNNIGYKLTEDGVIGTLTKEAIEDFQNTSGLTVDGKVGPQTYDKLSKVLSDEKLTNIYKSVNVLYSNDIVESRNLWINKASLDDNVYWLIYKVAQKFR